MPSILIVDDDRHTRALLERMCKSDARVARHELRVLQAGDGVEGLRIFTAEKPDLVVADLVMPRMDGLRFCQELRAQANGHSFALLVLSGVARDELLRSRLRQELGASVYTKPYQIHDLVNAIERQLSRLTRTDSVDTVRVDTVGDSPQPVNEPRRGTLIETPLARLLVDLHEDRATGTLELRRGRIEKSVDLIVGHPVAVTSNQRSEMLGHFLVLKGVITEKVHQQALELAHDEEMRLGAALQELGHLSSADLLKHLTSQARFKITRALRWPDGSWAFRPNRDLLEAAKGNALDPVAVVFLGLRRTSTPEQAGRVVAPLQGRRVGLTPRGERLKPTIARIFGAPLTDALATTQPLDELLAPPFEAGTTLPALEALVATGCATGVGPVEAEIIEMALDAEPPDLEELSGPLRLPPPPMPTRPPPEEDAPYEPSDSEIIEFDDEAGTEPFVSVVGEPETDALREELIGEYLRLQGADLYQVLEVSRNCEGEAVAAAFSDHMAAFSLEKFEKYDIGRDYAKLEEVHAAYRRAQEVLASVERRAAYDRELAGKRPRKESASMSAELAFRAGERRMAADNPPAAVEHFRLAVDAAPDVADYHAALGWALHTARIPGGRGELEQALAIDPDHAAGHEYLGRMLAETDDAAAAGHLERALDAEPPRLGALPALEALRGHRGELPLLERRYRAILARVAPSNAALALRLWMALARLYLEALHDRAAARKAYLCAARYAPGDPVILDALAELAEGSLAERAEILRARWRLDFDHHGPGLALVRAATEGDDHDLALLAASVLAARDGADGEAEAIHRRFRPRFLVRAMAPLAAAWPKIRHPEDDPELEALFADLAPVAFAHAPLLAADLGVREILAQPPAPLAQVRDYLAHLLGVDAPPVALQPDFGAEAHLGALAEPLLLVGPELIASKDKLELAFRLGRAMSYLWPGRAFAGSRPARVLKELFLAALVLGNPAVAIESSAGLARAMATLADLPDDARARAAGRASKLAAARTSVNLSAWQHALARSADRVGLLVSGDVVRAAAAVRVLGGNAAASDLCDFATSAGHRMARSAIGVSIAV
jgi:DNA-binding response OmpR family regulator